LPEELAFRVLIDDINHECLHSVFEHFVGDDYLDKMALNDMTVLTVKEVEKLNKNKRVRVVWWRRLMPNITSHCKRIAKICMGGC
jgi:hypothetical protein